MISINILILSGILAGTGNGFAQGIDNSSESSLLKNLEIVTEGKMKAVIDKPDHKVFELTDQETIEYMNKNGQEILIATSQGQSGDSIN